MTDTQNVIAPEAVAEVLARLRYNALPDQSGRFERSAELFTDAADIIAALHRLPTQSIDWSSLHCRFDRCGGAVVGIYHVPQGCLCWPDPVQALCGQHIITAESTGPIKTIVERPTQSQLSQGGVLQDDLRELLLLLGMGDHARPQSPHEVFQECLAELRRRLEPAPGAEAVAALEALVHKLDEIHHHPAYKSVWEINQIHCGPYRGPNYREELERARAALRSPATPAPAQGVAVTDKMIEAGIGAYESALEREAPWREAFADVIRAALEAALHPAEKE